MNPLPGITYGDIVQERESIKARRSGCWEDANVGKTVISRPIRITEEIVRIYCQITGCAAMKHLNYAYGPLGLVLADCLKTQTIHPFEAEIPIGWTWNLVSPIKVGDELHLKITVGNRCVAHKPGWDVITLQSDLINQHGEIVEEGQNRLMVARRPDTAC